MLKLFCAAAVAVACQVARAEATPYTHLDFLDDPDEFQFAVLPDLFGADPDGEPYRGAFTNAIKALNLLRPQFVMSVGDLIPFGWVNDEANVRAQQEKLMATLKDLKPPFFCVVGNHDICTSSAGFPAAYEISSRVWKDYHGPNPYYSFVYRNVLFIALNSMGAGDARIDAEQYDWFKRQLDEHPDVRWTFVFMHAPSVWVSDPNWFEFEKANLVSRRYTVFAGDWHQYLHVKRHGHDYYALSVAGGAGGMGGADYGRRPYLLGPAFGEFDHITMVTVTKDGPVIANVAVDGVLPHDVVSQATTLSSAVENMSFPNLDYPADPRTAERFRKLQETSDVAALFADDRAVREAAARQRERVEALAAATAINTFPSAGTFYVDDDNYGKSGLDGSTEALAFGTIQDAVDAAPGGSTILVLPGTYDKGGAEDRGFLNRVFVKDKPLTVRSTGGKAVTTIVGAKDPDTLDDPLKRGNGPKAVRAVKILNVAGDRPVAFEGFTIVGAAVNEPQQATADNFGSAVYVTGTNARYGSFVDCDFHGNTGSRGLLYGGTYVRCFLHDNVLPNGKGIASWKGTLLNCVVTRSAGGAVLTGGRAVNCTFVDLGNETDGAGNIGSEGASFVNSLILRAGCGDANVHFTNCVAQLVGTVRTTAVVASNLGADAVQCVSPLTDDFRLLATSAARGAGDAAYLADVWVPDGVDPYVDFYGEAIPKTGAIAAGAAQRAVTPDNGLVTFADPVTVIDENEARQGYVGGGNAAAAVTVTVDVDETARPLVGFLVDGTELVPDRPATFTPPATGVKTVDVLFSTNWYVNANTDASKGVVGDDANTGFTPETPKRTLQAVMGCALRAGDVIHAAPGVYDRGSMAELYKGGNGNATTPVRVCVGPGLTLVGDEGAAKTVIRGECTATDATIPFGGGAAMRCLNLANGATVVGFTLTGGSTPYVASSGQLEPYLGGGIIAPQPSGDAKPLVVDCVISNNCACRGGGVFGAVLRNCRVIDNYSTEDGNATFNTRLEGCLVDLNRGKSDGACVVRYPWGIFNTTITERNISVDTGKPSKYFVYNYQFGGASGASYGMANSIVMGGSEDYVSLGATNCLFNAEAASTYGKDANWRNCRLLTRAELKLAADGVPADDSPAIDKGDNALVVTEQALNGVPRICNGVVDIGCYEKAPHGLTVLVK